MDFIIIPAFVVITYLMCEVYKWYSDNKSERAKSFIPILAGIVGLILGVAGFYITPTYLGAENVFTAAAIGISSGLAAVGVNQIIRH